MPSKLIREEVPKAKQRRHEVREGGTGRPAPAARPRQRGETHRPEIGSHPARLPAARPAARRTRPRSSSRAPRLAASRSAGQRALLTTAPAAERGAMRVRCPSAPADDGVLPHPPCRSCLSCERVVSCAHQCPPPPPPAAPIGAELRPGPTPPPILARLHGDQSPGCRLPGRACAEGRGGAVTGDAARADVGAVTWAGGGSATMPKYCRAPNCSNSAGPPRAGAPRLSFYKCASASASASARRVTSGAKGRGRGRSPAAGEGPGGKWG